MNNLPSFALLVAAYTSAYFAGKTFAEIFKTNKWFNGLQTIILYVCLLFLFFGVAIVFKPEGLTSQILLCVWCFLASIL